MSKHDKALDKQAATDIGWLVRSVTRMVRPLVRLCVGRMSCNAVINVVKRAYVEEATRYLERENPEKKVTKSALALLSGLDSRAVDSIMRDKPELSSTGDILPEAAILEAWATDGTYKDQSTGMPSILPIYGKGLTFQTLVSRAAGRNVTCQTVLDKLTRSNSVEIIEDTHVKLVNQYVSTGTSKEKETLEVGSFAIGRLANSVTHNLETDESQSKWLQQERWSVKIPCSKLKTLKQNIQALIEEQILSAEEMLEVYEDPVKTNAHCSAGLGWYYWESSNDRT